MSQSGRKFFVGGNWKCNGSKKFIKDYFDHLNAADFPSPEIVEVVISPPFVFLENVKQHAQRGVLVAAQDCFYESKGAFTSAVSPDALVDLEIPYVIIGHSERRQLFGDTDPVIGKKIAKAQSLGLKVIACLGETLADREAGNTTSLVLGQLQAIAAGVTNWTNVVLAYEPVWAIGTGLNATPAQAQEVHSLIRQWLRDNLSAEVADSTRIIYGGSVKEDNAHDLALNPDVDGFLVGGASLLPSFVTIINSASAKK